MRVLYHAWLPALIVVGLYVGVAVWLWKRRRDAERPLTLADEELAPWYPWGSHPVVIPQTYVLRGVAPAPPPAVGSQTPVVAG